MIRHTIIITVSTLCLSWLIYAYWLPQESNQVLHGAMLGREVYIAEGCIHCHSQYIRPENPTDARWGQATSLNVALRESPVLIGNRRQGPDLSTVGQRRTREWNRLHLSNPRSVIPGSRMPSYAHLFEGDAVHGMALLDYLESLNGTEEGIAVQAQTKQTQQP